MCRIPKISWTFHGIEIRLVIYDNVVDEDDNNF